MVLKRQFDSIGFTLIEVLVAMTIAGFVITLAFSFFKDFGSGIRKGVMRTQIQHSEIVWLSSLEHGLREGQGLFEISKSSLVFFNRAHQRVKLEKTFEDSVLWNGKKSPIAMPGLEFKVYGPDCEPFFLESDPDCRILMDSLDENRDGVLEIDEMDRDRDGFVSGRENRFVRLVELRWHAAFEQKWRSLQIHPRWRLEALPDESSF